MTPLTDEPTHATVIALRPPVPVATVQGSLALDLTPAVDPPLEATLEGLRRPDFGLAPMPRERLDGFLARYLTCALEVSIGDRPAAQLLRNSSPAIYHELCRRAQIVAGAAGTSRSAGRGAGAVRPVLKSTHTQAVAEGVVEVAARARYGGRNRAVAARFEVRAGRWQCVALEIG